MTSTPYQISNRQPTPGVVIVPFTVDAASIADGNILTDYIPGFPFRVLGIDAVTQVAVTTASKATTVTTQIDGVSTGHSVTVSGTKALGSVTSGTDLLLAVTGSATSKLRFVASATTTFSEGRLSFLAKIRNLETV